MDHATIKANQTAAVYVADGLDGNDLEAFEVHMMGCVECVEDVETWRAIKVQMPRKTRTIPAYRRAVRKFGGWGLAASLFVAALLLSIAGGWLAHAKTGADIDRAVVFDLPKVVRGIEACSAVALAADTQVVVVRVDLNGVGPIVARGTEKGQLRPGQYRTHIQPDGTQLLRIDARLLAGRAVHLYARQRDGSEEPIGCITAKDVVLHSS